MDDSIYFSLSFDEFFPKAYFILVVAISPLRKMDKKMGGNVKSSLK